MDKKVQFYRNLLVLCAAFALLIVSVFTFRARADHPPVVYISGMLVHKSIEDLFEQSSLVVQGKVTGHSDAFQIQNVSGSIANFTDYYFSIENILRGDSNADTISIRVEGGTAGGRTEIYECSPDLNQDNEYILFLYKPNRGGAYNTEGDYYYIVGLTQGTFIKDDQGAFVSVTGETLPDDVFRSPLNDKAVNNNYFRDTYISNQQKNLESGVITQEDYNYLMENIDQYATIIK